METPTIGLLVPASRMIDTVDPLTTDSSHNGTENTSSCLPKTTKGKIKTGEFVPYFPALTPVELYKCMPQVPEATYESEGTFNNALYFLVKNGWLQEDESAVLSSMNP